MLIALDLKTIKSNKITPESIENLSLVEYIKDEENNIIIDPIPSDSGKVYTIGYNIGSLVQIIGFLVKLNGNWYIYLDKNDKIPDTYFGKGNNIIYAKVKNKNNPVNLTIGFRNDHDSLEPFIYEEYKLEKFDKKNFGKIPKLIKKIKILK